MKNRARLLFLGVLAIVSLNLGGYLLASAQMNAVGFPLDDAWIHQTYARNLGEFGEWSFVRGFPSAGSTSPLWSFWLALGYALRVDKFLWTFLSGAAALVFLLLVGSRLIDDGTHKTNPIWLGLFLACEWHLVWAALSGMETLLYGVLVLAVLLTLKQERVNWVGVGALVGLACWLRPDGIVLMAPAGIVSLVGAGGLKKILQRLGLLSVGFSLLIIPYLVFNLIATGALLPNTFFAKQAEYAIRLAVPLMERMIDIFTLPLIGGGIFLMPGFLYACYRIIKKRDVWGIGAVIWWLAFTMIYVLRLPVTYQHGRYLIPAMPIFWIVGWMGSRWMAQEIMVSTRIRRLVSFAWRVGLVVTTIGFLLFGAQAFAEDTAIINTEMVGTAHWVAQNTPVEAVIGAHDIGALGYYSHRRIVDLAGLISPEVIPFITDQRLLQEYLIDQRADYLVTFPGWYDRMTSEYPIVYQSKGLFSPGAGGENMAVYALRK